MTDAGRGVASARAARDALVRAHDHFARHDWQAGTVSYHEAADHLRAASGLDEVWAQVVTEHVTQLHAADQPALAIGATTRYQSDATGGDRRIRAQVEVLHAAGLAQRFDWDACRRVLAALDPDALAAPNFFSATHLRLRGRLAIHRDGDVDEGRSLLERSAEEFERARHPHLAAAIRRDIAAARSLEQETDGLAELVGVDDASTVAHRLRAAALLVRAGRPQQALDVLDLPGDRLDDPEVAFEVLYQRANALEVLRDRDGVSKLAPELRRAASLTDAAEVNGRRVQRVLREHVRVQGSALDTVEERESTVHEVSLQLAELRRGDPAVGELDRLVERLTAVADADDTTRLGAAIHELLGDVLLTKAERVPHPGSDVERARRHLTVATRLAEQARSRRVWATSHRLLGDLEARFGKDHRAIEHWAAAYEADEHTASAVTDDDARVRYLAGSPDVHDQLVGVTYRRWLGTGDSRWLAAFLVQLESARGAAVLPALTSGGDRNLENPGDLDGSWRAVEGWRKHLERDQAVWFLHVHPDGIYQALLARDVLHASHIPLDVTRLEPAIDEMLPLRGDHIEDAVRNRPHDFDSITAELCVAFDVQRALSVLSPKVQRIAVVAGGPLARLPFAALPRPGSTDRLLHRYAFSYLPCLSLLAPLAARSATQRGRNVVRVKGRIDGSVGDSDANVAVHTRSEARTLLEAGAAHCRVDSHGEHDPHDPLESYLQFEPASGDSGRLTARDLRTFDLSGTGLMTLGACETGLSKVRGRNEDFGFVRAALLAGASSIVTAGFRAEDSTAQSVLDRFERQLEFRRKDCALQFAMLAHLDGAADGFRGLSHPTHPLRWACWALHGDSGFVTDNGPRRRRAAERRMQYA